MSACAAPVAGTSTPSPSTAVGGLERAGNASPAPTNTTPSISAATRIEASMDRRGIRRSRPIRISANGHSWLTAPHSETGMRPRLIKSTRVPKPISKTGPARSPRREYVLIRVSSRAPCAAAPGLKGRPGRPSGRRGRLARPEDEEQSPDDEDERPEEAGHRAESDTGQGGDDDQDPARDDRPGLTAAPLWQEVQHQESQPDAHQHQRCRLRRRHDVRQEGDDGRRAHGAAGNDRPPEIAADVVDHPESKADQAEEQRPADDGGHGRSNNVQQHQRGDPQHRHGREDRPPLLTIPQESVQEQESGGAEKYAP